VLARVKNVAYTVRTVSVPEDGEHYCSGRIVAVLGATQNPATRVWYLTALVERPTDEDKA
jgi:hypothetical protein